MGEDKRKRYDSSVVITLPKMNAHECGTLSQQLLTHADKRRALGDGLPELVEYGRKVLSRSYDELAQALRPLKPEDSAAAREADAAEDAAWSMFRKWLESFVDLAGTGNEAFSWAPELNGLVFGDGLTFTNTTYKEQWSQTQARLEAIVTEGFEPVIARHGGGPLYEGLQAAHEQYGEVLGITTSVDVDESQEVGKHMDATVKALKDYVMKVGAQVRADRPETQSLVDDLMLPLAEWGSTSTGSSTGATGAIPRPGAADDIPDTVASESASSPESAGAG